MKRALAAAVGIGLVFAWPAAAAPDHIFADFEAPTYGSWRTEGTAFGDGPAAGARPGQMDVDGFAGRALANSFSGGDASRGRLVSPPFTVAHRWISFLVGGGGFPGTTCINLVVEGRAVRTATGPNTRPGGSEHLAPRAWEVAELAGKSAHLEIVDDATGGWGHINIDHVVFTDAKPRGLLAPGRRSFTISDRWLEFPVDNGAPQRTARLHVDGREERAFEIELADSDPDWWAPLDLSAWRGAEVTVTVDELPDDSRAMELIAPAPSIRGADLLYREPLRPGLHFSAQRGWLNDPNGLVHHAGQFHLFFQHNPFGVEWGNMHWGHAVSSDLVHWRELGDALHPDTSGTMFSGSAVVDHRNSSGLGSNDEAPVVLFYTAAGGTGPASRGKPFTQCLAALSADGHSATKFSGNPVISEITAGNRDPKVFWHEPTQRWVMVLYVERNKRHMAAFLTSSDLRNWTLRSESEGFYECPDFFPLTVDGDPGRMKWVLTGANSSYQVGGFDGSAFTPETPMLAGHRGKGFYAAQTFSDTPDGRRIQIGWLQAPSPGMPFNQCLSLPLGLTLRTTAEGPRLAWQPVRELEKLRAATHEKRPLTLRAGDPNPFPDAQGELIEVRAEVAISAGSTVTLTVRGIDFIFDGRNDTIIAHGHRVPNAGLRAGGPLALFVDRTVVELFAAGGLTYVPLPAIPRSDQRSVSITVDGQPVTFTSLAVHELRPLWKP